MKKKKLLVIVITLLVLIVIGAAIYSNFYFTLGKSNNSENNIGIIDGYLSQNEYKNLNYYSKTYVDKKTHGDQLIDYINNKNFHGKIYYYPAVNANGKITSEKIIDALDWMVEHNINTVNISLSTKKHNEELSKWFDEHSDINVYCSYNNQENSFDYPAMYSRVIASGSSKQIKYKNVDVQYRTNRIIVWNHGIHFYYGNSFLSLETLLVR